MMALRSTSRKGMPRTLRLSRGHHTTLSRCSWRFAAREGNPTLSVELVASYQASLVGEGKSSSTVSVHLAAIKALIRAGHGRVDAGRSRCFRQGCEGRAPAWERIGNWLTRGQAQELFSLPDR